MAAKTKNKKTTVVPFRLDPDELEELDTRAAEAGRTRSDFLREALRMKLVRKRRRPDREALLDASQALKGVGRNFNQLTRYAHQNGGAQNAAQIQEMHDLVAAAVSLAGQLQAIALGEAEVSPPNDHPA